MDVKCKFVRMVVLYGQFSNKAIIVGEWFICAGGRLERFMYELLALISPYCESLRFGDKNKDPQYKSVAV